MSLSLWGYLSHTITVAITNRDTIIPCQDYCNTLLLGLTTSFLIFFFFFFLNIYFIIYSAALGLSWAHRFFSCSIQTLSCGMWD